MSTVLAPALFAVFFLGSGLLFPVVAFVANCLALMFIAIALVFCFFEAINLFEKRWEEGYFDE